MDYVKHNLWCTKSTKFEAHRADPETAERSRAELWINLGGKRRATKERCASRAAQVQVVRSQPFCGCVVSRLIFSEKSVITRATRPLLWSGLNLEIKVWWSFLGILTTSGAITLTMKSALGCWEHGVTIRVTIYTFMLLSKHMNMFVDTLRVRTFFVSTRSFSSKEMWDFAELLLL